MSNLEEFFENYPTKSIKTGEIILAPGENINHLYLLTAGSVRMYITTDSGQEINLHQFEPNSVFPLMLVYAEVPNKYFVEAVIPTELKVAPTNKVIEFIASHPEEQINLLKRLSKGIVGLSKRIEMLTTQNTAEQIESLKKYFKDHRNLPPPTQQQIADWIGKSRETVSRTKKRVLRK